MRVEISKIPEKQQKPKAAGLLHKPAVLIAMAVVVLLSGVLLWHFVIGPQFNDAIRLEDSIKAKLGQLEDKSNEEIEAALNEIVEEGCVSISINMNPVFPSRKAEGTLKIENGPQNLYNQRVVITLADTGEEIYHSGLMPINSHIQTDMLEKELEPGEYDAIATFHAYDTETDREIGAAVARIRISILT